MQERAFDPDDRRPETPKQSRLMAVREHSLMALLELNRELSVRFEARQVVDVVLFNLMGHLGTRQAALWLMDRARPGRLELIRGHGIPPTAVVPVTAALSSSLDRWSARTPAPVCIDGSDVPFDSDAVTTFSEAGLALIGPLPAHNEIIGFVGLGRRVNGDAWSDLDVEVFHSSLGVAGVAIENSRLFHELEARNRSLAGAYRDLMELDKMKTEFVQNVNHELRTPLAIISGAVECLLDPADPDPNRHRLHAGISEQAAKLGAMVQSLLDLSTVSNVDAGELEPVQLEGFIERYGFERSVQVSNARHTLRIGPSPGGTVVRIAPVDLTRALDLLLENALKFTPEGCTITIAVIPDADDPGCACLVFADNGCGFAPDRIERVFRPFYQVDGSSTRTAGGLGIGLALVKRMIVSMGGRIDVENASGGGAAFRIRLRLG
jgi:signal transduction histidine kinase